MYQSKRYARGRTALALVAATVIAVPVAAIAAPPSGGGGSTPSPVLVTNDATKPVPVSVGNQPLSVTLDGQQLTVAQVPGGQPVSVWDPMVMQPNETNLFRDLIEVPAGKRLIVEYVSGEVIRTEDARFRVFLAKKGVHRLATMPLQPALGVEAGLRRGLYSEQTHIILDGPGTLQAQLFRLDPNLTAAVSNTINVHGTLYDCASCQ